jgi:hypothetical protein
MARTFLSVAVALLIGTSNATHAATTCNAGERAVAAQTPVLGGPGLGFDVIRVIEKDLCLRILSTTDDGSFLLVELEAGKAGWITSGTVDTKLSATAEGAVSASGNFVAVRELVLRATPRFDSVVVGASLPPRTPLTRKAVSVDGQWFLVVEEREAGSEGWVPKYQVAETFPEDGSAAAATSTEGWGAARLSRKPFDAAPSSSTPPVGEPTVPQAADAPPQTPETGPETPLESEKRPAVAPTTDEALPPPVATVLLGRTQELAFTFGYRYWLQSYTSDAQQDPFFKYELAAPLGLGMSIDYGWRGEFPLVVDVRAQLGFNGYETLHVDNNIYTVIGSQFSAWPRIAWRLHDNEIVDVDAGLTMGLDGLMNYGVQLQDVSSTLSGFYFGAGPTIAARSRLGDGEWGLLVIEASIPIGGYTMFPDPGARYTEYAAGRADELGSPGLVYHEATVASGYNPETDLIDFRTVTAPRTAGASPLHFMVGADGRVRYLYAFSSLWRVECGGAFTVRQGLILGPGRRNGSYSEAANIDTILSLFAGVNFGL